MKARPNAVEQRAAAFRLKIRWKSAGHAHILFAMKFVSLLSLVMLWHAAALGETAYQALRALGSQQGQEQLNRVIEVLGRDGGPNPETWKVILDDPTARGGVREVEVKRSEVVSERTPVRAYSGAGANAVMNFKRLNLDSEGAFTIANNEATRAKVGFDKVHYTLRGADETNAPVWVLQLVDASGRNVGSVHVAADSGEVLRRELGTANRGRVTDEDYVAEERVVVERRRTTRTADDEFPEERDPEREYRDGDAREYADDPDYAESGGRPGGVRDTIKKTFRSAGATLEEFFTGKRTIDRKHREE